MPVLTLPRFEPAVSALQDRCTDYVCTHRFKTNCRGLNFVSKANKMAHGVINDQTQRTMFPLSWKLGKLKIYWFSFFLHQLSGLNYGLNATTCLLNHKSLAVAYLVLYLYYIYILFSNT